MPMVAEVAEARHQAIGGAILSASCHGAIAGLAAYLMSDNLWLMLGLAAAYAAYRFHIWLAGLERILGCMVIQQQAQRTEIDTWPKAATKSGLRDDQVGGLD